MENINEVKETLKEMFRAVINNAKNGDDEKGRWITVKGTHVFIPDGANQEEVVKDFLKKKNKEDKSKWKSYKEDNPSEGKTEKDSEKTAKWIKSKYGQEWQLEKNGFSSHIHAKKDDGYSVNIFDKDGKNTNKYKSFTSKEDAMKYAEEEIDKLSKDKGKSKEKSEDDELVTLVEADPEYIKRNKETNDRWQKAIKETAEREGWNKPDTEKKDAKGNKPVDISKFQFKNYKNPEGQNHKGYETYKSSFESISKETEHVPEKVKKQYNGNTPPYEAARTEFSHINANVSARDLMDSWTNRNKDYKPVIDAILERQNAILEELKPYNKWNGKEWVKSADNSIKNGLQEIINNCKPKTEEDLQILYALKEILEDE